MGERDLLMIPGPVEVEPAVLRSMGRPTPSHLAPDFIEAFGTALDKLKSVFLADEGQPFVVAGSGTLAMDMAATNLVEPDDKVLVVSTGYFSERFANICERYGADVTIVRAEPGDVPATDTVAQSLADIRPKLLVLTHVDTSTGVIADVESLASVARENGALTVVDGVCATGGAEFRQSAWDVDVCLTASQKALAVPPGLAIVMVGPRAMEAIESRATPVQNYYADFTSWLPVMQAYMARRPDYFGTPPVNLILALRTSLNLMLSEGMEGRFRRHQLIARAFQAAMEAVGLRQLPRSPALRAPTMSAVYYPEAVDSGLLGKIRDEGVIVAGGLLPQIAGRYFRVGHMGSIGPNDILATVGAIERALRRSGYEFDVGAGLEAAQRVLLRL
jgi:alanine-glyoxylate transaminase/serine-glyoxylate transaminase/serine-pyruvate transaminase